MIVRCPVCQCEIVHNGVTKSHATYTECLDALNTELFVIVRRMRDVTRQNVIKSERLEKELSEVYELKV